MSIIPDYFAPDISQIETLAHDLEASLILAGQDDILDLDFTGIDDTDWDHLVGPALAKQADQVPAHLQVRLAIPECFLSLL